MFKDFVSVKPLGSYLIDAGLLSSQQVEEILVDQQQSKKRFGEIAAEWGWIKQQTIEYLMQRVILPERSFVCQSIGLASAIAFSFATPVQAKQKITTTPDLAAVLGQETVAPSQLPPDSFSSPSSLAHSIKIDSLAAARAYALDLVNRDRSANGLPPLIPSPLLDQVAQNHAQDMLERGYYDHYSPEGSTPEDRYILQGGNPKVGVGENLMSYQNSRISGLSAPLLNMFQVTWMDSPHHRTNILTPDYKGFGYGVVLGADGKLYAVQMFSLGP